MSISLTHPVVAALAAVLATLMLALSFLAGSVKPEVLPEIEAPAVEAEAAPPAYAPERVTDDVLWLARVIYSETKRAEEQELVAWVIRNRVETRYRGKKTYREVVLDPWQFSAFNANDPKRRQFIALSAGSKAEGFEQALRIAHDVYYAKDEARPFSETTRHFYSERSMKGPKKHPNWAAGKRPVALDRSVDPRRFRFYASIS